MEKATQSLLVQATQALKLNDIALYSARFDRPLMADGCVFEEAMQQQKQGVTYTVGEVVEGSKAPRRVLQVRVSLGTRLVPKLNGVESGNDVDPLFEIEADFLVEYDMTDDLPEEALKAFAQFNAVHNVWPFWREHVFNIVGRGRLPRLQVPLYEGVVL